MSASINGPIRIWFNRTFSAAFHAVTLIRNNPDGVPVEVFGTHESLDAVFLGACDHVGLEPARLPAPGYIDFALDFCARNKIDVFVPKRYADTIAAHRAQFAEAGTALLIAGSRSAMAAVSDKGVLYETLERIAPAAAPRYRVVHNAGQFAAAVRALGEAGATVCFKPAVGEGGGGFRIIDDTVSPLAGLAGYPSERMPLRAAMHALSAVESFAPLVVSEFFDGCAEYSVDCLGRDGELLIGVVRHKVSARSQRIETAPALLEVTRRIAAEFTLGGLFNAQFMVGPAGAKVIDVNPRMAAGIDVAAASGVNLPWLGIRSSLGHEFAIPAPRSGLTVGRLDHLVTVSEPAAA